MCNCTLGAWPKISDKQRKRMPSRCFLFPELRKFAICKPRKPFKVSCEGVLSARRRAILNRDFEAERRAIAVGRRIGCGWADEAKAKRRGVRRSRRG